jgi:hypothetical protein
MFLYDELNGFVRKSYPNDPNCKRVMEVLYKQMTLCSRQQSGVEGRRGERERSRGERGREGRGREREGEGEREGVVGYGSDHPNSFSVI